MTRRVMSQVETVKMSQLMTQHIRVLPDVGTPEDPVCEYLDDWDDEKIAFAISKDLSSAHAATLRKNIFGRFSAKTVSEAEFLRRLEFVERKLGDTLLLMAELTSKHDKLCMGISLARVGVESRHLVVDPKAVLSPTIVPDAKFVKGK